MSSRPTSADCARAAQPPEKGPVPDLYERVKARPRRRPGNPCEFHLIIAEQGDAYVESVWRSLNDSRVTLPNLLDEMRSDKVDVSYSQLSHHRYGHCASCRARAA